LLRKAAEDKRASTYLAMAEAASLEIGGRYKSVSPMSITGTTPFPVYPAQPESSPYHHDPTGNLPDPLGYSISDQEVIGEPFEQIEAQRLLDQRSLARPRDGGSDDVPAASTSAAAVELSEPPTHPTTSLRRRL
jgi:hypothetical protein